jgi:hypothetical protein
VFGKEIQKRFVKSRYPNTGIGFFILTDDGKENIEVKGFFQGVAGNGHTSRVWKGDPKEVC